MRRRRGNANASLDVSASACGGAISASLAHQAACHLLPASAHLQRVTTALGPGMLYRVLACERAPRHGESRNHRASEEDKYATRRGAMKLICGSSRGGAHQ